MKKYLRYKSPFIFFSLLIWGVIVGIVFLDGYQNYAVIGYTGLLIVVLVGLYLTIDFQINRFFYYFLTDKSTAKTSNGYLSQQVKKQLLNQKRQHSDELKRLDQQQEEQRRFMDSWIHQMKTPVAVLELMAETVEIEPYEVLLEVDRLKSGLATALTYSRLTNVTEDFLIEEQSIRTIVQEAINEQKRSFITKKIFPTVDSTNDFIVFTDKKWLKIALFQLISNAIKYSPSQSNLSICFDAEKKMLSLSDKGCGIPKEDIPRVFRPFFTGQNGRTSQEATGMGLYLVSKICQQLTIDVRIKSVVNHGTTVTLQFKDDN